jgi:hypothetical protein
MGGLLTTATDLGKYIAFHLSAWPPRDDPETGPVRRASVREMAHRWTPSNLTAKRVNGGLSASETGYGYGLRVTSDCRFEKIVAHGGGLPGFGSYMAWLPDYGVGMFAMATLTYSGPSEPMSAAWNAMRATGGLRKRELPPTGLQTRMRDHIFDLWKRWDDAAAKRIAAVNLLLDVPAGERRDEIEKLKREVGDCGSAGPVMPENWLRGQFNMKCDREPSASSPRCRPPRLPRCITWPFGNFPRRTTAWGRRPGRPRGRLFALDWRPSSRGMPRPNRPAPELQSSPARF